jgi:hypothetical protein
MRPTVDEIVKTYVEVYGSNMQEDDVDSDDESGGEEEGDSDDN